MPNSFLYNRTACVLTAAILWATLALAQEDVEKIQASQLQRHVQALTAADYQGRMTGTEEIGKVAAYLASYYESCGLLPAGDNGTYYQAFPFIAGTYVGKNNNLTLVHQNKQESLALHKDFTPLLFSDIGQTQGPLVFVGYGIAASELGYNEYDNIDVQGKIVLLMRYSPDGNKSDTPFANYDRLYDKAIVARDKGAKGVLLVTGPLHRVEDTLLRPTAHGPTPNMKILCVQISQHLADRLLSPTGKSLAVWQKSLNDTRKPNSFVIPEMTISLEVDLVQEQKQCRNVLAYLPPSIPSTEELAVVGAHYDHLGLGGETSRAAKKYGEIHPGADDNASGVAGTLELARYFSGRRQHLKRGLLFANFSGEELGLLGSSAYVKTPFRPLAKTVAMINLDMLGRLNQNVLIVNSTDTSPQWEPLLDRRNQTYAFTLKKMPGGFTSSDSSAFYKENIPVLFFFTNLHEDYHKPSDTWDKLDYPGMAKVVSLVADVTEHLVSTDNKITFTRSKQVQEGAKKNVMRVYTGTIPEFGVNVDGYQIAGVQPDSPAEKAGLQKDDIIIKVGAKNIHNIYDYMASLKTLKAGDKVEFVFRRADKQGKAMLELGAARGGEK